MGLIRTGNKMKSNENGVKHIVEAITHETECSFPPYSGRNKLQRPEFIERLLTTPLEGTLRTTFLLCPVGCAGGPAPA